MINPFRYFFQKRAADLNLQRIEQEQRMRFNPLRNFDPDTLVRAIDNFRVGYIGDLSKIIDELETRDDMMTGAARKTRASVGRCPHQVLVVEGAENDPRAEEHRKILTRFWSGIEVTSAFSRNERGGVRLLKKQMMGAVSRMYAVHEIVWKPLPDGEITASFIQTPNWFFENHTGSLRFLNQTGAIYGKEMLAGEWLVTVGDGIGIAASVLAMSKTLSRNDWLLFSERCGQPGLHVQTDAVDGSPAWDRLVSAARNFGREWAMVSDNATKLTPIDLNTGGQLPYPPLIEMCNKGIAALYRGADLSTISGASGDSTGASVQGDETDILEQDACELVSETLNAQVDRYVIRYMTGDDIPLAYVSIAPTERPNVDQDTKIDNHLISHGVPLSRNDALARYGRSLYDPTDTSDAPLLQTPVALPAQTALYNSKQPNEAVAKPLQNDPPASSVKTDAKTTETSQNDSDAILAAFAKDMSPAGKAVADLLSIKDPDDLKAAAAQLAKVLPSMLSDDPEMAALIEEAIANVYATSAEGNK